MAGAGEGEEGGAPRRSRIGSVELAVIILVVIAVVLLAVAILRLGQPEVERSEWAFDMVQLNKANDEGLTGKGVRVGIVDTGIDTGHPSLKEVKVKHWRDFVNSRSFPAMMLAIDVPWPWSS